MSAGSSEPPLERVLTLRGPITRERPYSDTVWNARDEHRLMSSEAPVEICKRHPRVMHNIMWRAHHKRRYWPHPSWSIVSKPPPIIIQSTKRNVAPEDHHTLKLDTAEEAQALVAVSCLFGSY